MALIKENITYVDGYNVINKWPKLREAARESLETAREDLIEDLAEYSFLSGGKNGHCF